MELLVKYTVGLITLFLLFYGFTFIDILSYFCLFIFFYRLIHQSIKETTPNIKFNLFRNWKFQLSLILLSQSSLILLNLKYFDNIYNIKSILLILTSHISTIIAYSINIFHYMNYKTLNHLINLIILPVILCLGYYFYSLIPQDIVNITGLGHQYFSDFYLILISFLYLLIFSSLFLSTLMPTLSLFNYFTIFMDNRKKFKIKYQFFIIPIVCLISIPFNFHLLNENYKNIRSSHFLTQAIVEIFYYDKLPERCDNTLKENHQKDKFMLIDLNYISVASFIQGKYTFSIEKCQKDFL